VRLIVGFAAGGPTDIAARLIGQSLSDRLGQPFIIENRPGASSNVAAEAVTRANPDGYTLLFFGSAATWNQTLYDNLSFDFVRDIVPVAGVLRYIAVMVVNPEFPAKTVPEFITYAKANPGKINMASSGPGSAPGMFGELFKAKAGVDLTTVNYRGSGPAYPDLFSGRTQVMFDIVTSAIGPIRAGQVRALGVTSPNRLGVLPEIPPVGEFVPGYEAVGWQGIGAPKNTPSEIVAILNHAVNTALADQAFKARLADLGGDPFAISTADFTQLVADDTEKWGKVIRAANIKPE
jgi:tripartite-type tricarboxylate transporter receptor subunit TctC